MSALPEAAGDTSSHENLKSSERRSNTLSAVSPPAQKPETIGDFIGLVNDVAVKVLNGEIEIDQARTFASLARVVSQSMSTRVQARRFLPSSSDVLELK